MLYFARHDLSCTPKFHPQLALPEAHLLRDVNRVEYLVIINYLGSFTCAYRSLPYSQMFQHFRGGVACCP